MVLLIGFAFLAGAGTAVSPCVLPVLPVVLSAGATGGKRRPLGIVTGLALSFTFATVALVYVIDALGLPSGLPRTLAIVVLFAFGMALLLPPLGARVEAFLGRFSGRFGAAGAQGDGFRSGLLVGVSLGFVYAPCAGPILAGVITVSAAQSFTAGRLAVALAYGLGSAAILYALALGGRRLTSRLSRRAGRLQVAMGAVMVLVAVAMLANLDTRFENAIASDVPGFLVDPTKSLENSHTAQKGLAGVRGGSGHVRSAAGTAEADAGLRLPVLGAAPELVGLDKWFNTPGGQPLTLAQLRGRVVLVDFWTYSCINCIRTLPYLRAWDAQYRSKGLTVIGIHTPEFPFEHDPGNVQAAISQDGLRYPVAQDNEYQTWSAYSNQYWPAEYLIDAQGQVRLVDFGEGNYSGKERAIRSLLVEAGAQGLGGPVGASTRAQAPPTGAVTPESYLGSARAQRFVNGQIKAGAHDYGALQKPPTDDLAYGGRWQVGSEAATAGPGASLALRFHARRVFLVLGSPRQALQTRVLLDGRPVPASAAGSDVRGASLTVHAQKLYELIDLRKPETHLLTLLPAAGVSGYAFTFG